MATHTERSHKPVFITDMTREASSGESEIGLSAGDAKQQFN